MIPLKNLENYFIDENGDVFSSKYGTIRKLKSYTNKNGYRYISLCKNNKKISKRICVLMGENFLNNDGSLTVNHIDGDKTNDKLYNLELCSLKDNIIHAVKTGLIYRKGSKHNQAILTESQVLEIRRLSKCGMRNIDIAKKFNLKERHIGKIVRRDIWIHV